MEYDRVRAVAYAKRWAYRRNSKYYDFSNLGGNCTNFASQCIYAGAGVMNYTPVYGWYYISLNNRAPAWTGVNELYNFLVNNKGPGPQGEVVPLRRIIIGDIVQLNFGTDDSFDHSPVVVDAGMGTPDTVLIAANSYDADCRQLSTYNYVAMRPIHIYNVNPPA
ncbi:MAG: amidase domain-containing protein [Oscillospiraceae bacterium]|nr:amidase domain-containing protein [Oscillospiraceae bacterium]